MPSQPVSSRRALLLAGAGTFGCQALGIKATVTSRKKDENGRMVTEVREVETLGELGDELAKPYVAIYTAIVKAAQLLAQTIVQIVEDIIEVPPPGIVALTDLGSGYDKYEGNPKFDMVTAARENARVGYDFNYVRINVAEYDEFFKAAAEHYALAFQRQETEERVRRSAAKALDEPIKVSEDIDQLVMRARADGRGSARAYVDGLLDVHVLNGVHVATRAKKTATLVSAGHRLVASAPKSILNPKVIRHLPLVVKGLGQSIDLIGDSGEIMAG